jgi:hypothetical protein
MRLLRRWGQSSSVVVNLKLRRIFMFHCVISRINVELMQLWYLFLMIYCGKNLSYGRLIRFPRISIDMIRYPSWQQFGAHCNMNTHICHYVVYATSNSTLSGKHKKRASE